MSELLVNFGDETNWQPIHNQTVVAPQRGGAQYVPLLPFDLPVLVSSPILMALAENLDVRPWWFLGYRLQQLVETGIAPGEMVGGFANVPLNRPKLIRFPRYSAQYALRVHVPPWLDRMKIVIYEYVGDISDTGEALTQEQADLIRIDLLRIEAKINQLQ